LRIVKRLRFAGNAVPPSTNKSFVFTVRHQIHLIAIFVKNVEKICAHLRNPSQSISTSSNRLPPKPLAEKILGARSNLEGERKLVTVLFADVAGYTAIRAGDRRIIIP
jgi:hypothetical protein